MKNLRLLCAALVLAGLVAPSMAATYYVDFDGGSDSNSGTAAGASWKHCPGDSNATGNAASTTPAPGDTIIFKGGVHYRGTVDMIASGTSGSPIVYDGNTAGTFGTGKAVIDGSQPLTGWTACSGATDGGNNPNWANIYKIALPAGVTLFTANLYEGETLLTMAQDPNVPDAMFYDDLSTYISVPYADTTDTATEVTVKDSSYFTQTDPNYWDGGYLHIWHNPNVVSTLAVTSFDPSTDTITTEPLGGGNIYTDRDALYSMGNCLPILDTPGEYVVDETNNMIYLWPLSGANPDSADVTVSVREYGLNVIGNDYITIQGFKAIRHAADFGGYHQGCGIRSHTGEADGLVIRDNEVAQNRSMEKYPGIYVNGGDSVLIEDNYVHENMRNKGIFINSLTNSIVRNNTVDKNGGTGIGLYGCIGGEVRGNLVTRHDGVHANGITLYLGCDGVLVIGNISRDGNVALTTQDAYNLTIAYNVFHSNIDGYTVADWNSSTRPSWNLEYYNNVIINHYNTGLSIGENGRSGLVFRNNIVDGAGIGSGTNISHNIYTSLMWSQSATYGWSLGTGEIVETDKSVVWVDAANHDYTLALGSPAINAGTTVGYSADIIGTAVPQGAAVDIGPFEWIDTGQNAPPNADAGEDQNVTDSDDNGSEDVTLDGSGSTDVDGTIASYIWEENSSQIGTGVSPTVTLDVNTHTIDLTVTDDDSATDSDSVVITVLAGGTVVSDSNWQNFTIATQTGQFTWEFDATPNQANMDGLTVLSLGPVADWADCAVTTRFNSSGDIDSYDGSVYTADIALPYSAGTSYHFRVTVDVAAQTYSIYVTPDGSAEQTLATDYAFRAAAGSPASLNNWGLKGQVGTHTVSNVTISTGTNVAPAADAGPDQNVTDNDDNGTEDVALDGSASADSDGTIASYIWEENSSQIATGVGPTVTLDVNVHTIDLTVTDDDSATDSDSVVITVNAAPASGSPTLTVVETAGDYYTVTAHDSADPQIGYWEIKVDIQSGGIFSFKDLTDAGDGSGGHNSYLDTDAYGRQCSLIWFDGRGGNVFTRSNPLAELSTHLTFTAAPDGSSFTITYAEDGTTTDWFHDSYGSDADALTPGDLVTTAELVITPPDETGTAWDWTLTSDNVSAHEITLKAWAEEYVSSYLYDSIVKTFDSDDTLADGAWNETTPESYMRWAIGSNPSLGFTAGREIIVDRKSALSAYTDGGTIAYTTWAGFAHGRYKSAFSYSGALAIGGSRVTTGQVLINITGTAGQANASPTANAGADQTVADNDDNGSEDVTLDGSTSSDSDGTITSYVWEENSSQIATGISPTVSLDVNVHTIDLTVTDDDSATDTDSVVITVEAYSAGEVLLVTGSGSLTSADQLVANLLTTAGFTVTAMDDDVASAGDATGKALVVISATVGGNTVGGTFRTVSVPVLTWEKDIMDDMDMTTSQNVQRKQTQIDIIDSSHAMAAGLSGTVSVYNDNEYLTWGEVTAAADVVASVTGNSSQATLFGYDTLDVMANGYPAPARRVGVFLDANSAEVLTADGESLIDAALTWALGL